MPTIQPAPQRLFENGTPVLGFFDRPVADVNVTEARPASTPLARRWRAFRTKEWLGLGIVHPDWYLSTMIQNAKYLATGVLYLADRRRGTLVEWTEARPAWTVPVAASAYDGLCAFHGSKVHLEFALNINKGLHTISLHLKGDKRRPDIDGELHLREDLRFCAPLVTSVPVIPAHHTYTHKVLMPVDGTLRIGDEEVRYDPARDLANLDEQKGYYPYRTFWKWGSGAGYDGQGRLFGFNLADHQFPDPDTHSENALWSDGKVEILGAMHFDFNEAKPLDPWHITDDKGRVDLTFRPEGRKIVRNQFLVAGIDYFQAYGTYTGRLLDAEGRAIPFSSLYGVAERMNMRS